MRHVWRLAGITLCLARHDALVFLLERLAVSPHALRLARLVSRRDAPGRPGQRLAKALQELGPSFIKLGQSLATRADLLGDEVAADLSELQDRLPPFPFEQARRTIEVEFGAPLEALYAGVEPIPVAAASIAQVHLAVTTAGDEVAVKILRPGVEAAMQRDLDLFAWVADWIESTQPGFRRLRPTAVIATFAASTRMEMDLRLEAAAASELAENLQDEPGFRVPRVDWRRTGGRVLTLERVNGIPLDERGALLAAGFDPDVILARAARVFFLQVFRDGFFHADMHPGNVFIDGHGDLVPVDFGIMGRLDKPTRRFLAEILVGFLTRDYRRVAEVHFRAGYVPADQDMAAFMQACRAVGEPILGLPLNEISVGRLLGQLFRVTETFQMETQPQLLLLQKTIVVAEGVGRALNPSVNMWQLAQPLIEEWIAANLGPQAELRDVTEEVLEATRRLPALVLRAERVLQRMEREEQVGPAARAGARAGRAVARHLLSSTMVWGLALLLAAVLLTVLLAG